MTIYTFSQIILNWYHKNGRKNLPWQKNKTLYTVWISEIMLQQTQVEFVIPYFKKFMLTFPDIKSLNNSTLDEILYLWSGLGYYNRARNIYKTTKIIMTKYKGIFPNTFTEIIKLPGIGKSTAGAILSLSLDFFYPILDCNIKRILIRYYGIIEFISIKKTEKKLWNIIESIIPIHNTSKFNQAMMDIGALICKKNTPKCNICPLSIKCITKKEQKLIKYSFKKNQIIKKKEKSWCILLKFKNTFWMEKNIKNEIWKNLFYFPNFNNEKSAYTWIKEKKIHIHKIEKIISFLHHFSHLTFHIHPILIYLSIKTKIKNINNLSIWYNVTNPPHVGIPQPVKKIFNMFDENIFLKKEYKVKK